MKCSCNLGIGKTKHMRTKSRHNWLSTCSKHCTYYSENLSSNECSLKRISIDRVSQQFNPPLTAAITNSSIQCSIWLTGEKTTVVTFIGRSTRLHPEFFDDTVRCRRIPIVIGWTGTVSCPWTSCRTDQILVSETVTIGGTGTTYRPTWNTIFTIPNRSTFVAWASLCRGITS